MLCFNQDCLLWGFLMDKGNAKFLLICFWSVFFLRFKTISYVLVINNAYVYVCRVHEYICIYQIWWSIKLQIKKQLFSLLLSLYLSIDLSISLSLFFFSLSLYRIGMFLHFANHAQMSFPIYYSVLHILQVPITISKKAYSEVAYFN